MEPGVRLGDFVLVEKIGEGAFGTVFRAQQESLAREAVVKVLHTRHASDATARARFLREARLASRLQHANAAHIYAFGAEPGGTPWIAMELVRGTPLSAHILLTGPLRLPDVVTLVEEIAAVVAAAHEQGIIHRDLKPANVMVVGDGEGLAPKLLDFGLARAVAAPPDDEPAAEPAGEPAGDDDDATAAAATDAALTRAGVRLGTPFYMAPEQWLPNGVADARTDQYALAVLTWECLVGHPPFRGTIVEIGRSHVQKPLPKLPGGLSLPPALDAVLARAAAKVKDDRYPSVSELAAALRAAAGLGPEVLPPLPASLAAAIGVAPQPVAESIAALQAARNAYQAIDAVRVAEQALLRYLAAVALAGRTRDAAAPIPEALGSLRRRAPDPEDWLELVADLLAPWRERPEDFPVPELARLFAGGIPTALLGNAGAGSSGDVPAAERLDQAQAALAMRTQALAFLFDYPLVLPRKDDGAEVWMGPRRLHRATAAPSGVVPTPGHPTLLDREGRPVLDLWPVAQAAPPAPGAPDELFLLAGPGPRGARLWAAPLGQERQDPAVWEWLRTALDERKGGGLGGEDAPWRGLRPYTRDDAARFFGRDEETQALANRLRTARLLAVVGPSGSGKSSLVQAGLIAALGPRWRVAIVRPGSDPLAELATVGADLAGEDTLLVVDQLEELFTLCHDDEVRRRFADAIVARARTARVVLTLRDDFLARAHQLPAFRDRLGAALVLLALPAPSDLLRIVTEPARLAGYTFDDRELPAAMVADVGERPGALALLSFTAAALWERRDRHFRQLLRRAYDDMGGVGGALARHAEATLAAFPASEQRRVREAFRQLVTAEGTRAVLARSELAPVAGDAVVERLIAARLLSASDEGQVEIAHEALLEAWPRLAEWRREDADGVRLRDQLRAAARTWSDRGRPRDVLWRGKALGEYQAWRARGGGVLTPTEEAFVAASSREAARGRRLRRSGVGVAFVVLAVVAVVMFALSRRAARNAADAHARLLDSYVDQGRQYLLAGDPLRGLTYLRQAMREGEDGPVARFLVARGLEALAPERLVLPVDGLVRVVAFNGDGTRAMSATRDGHLAVWDTMTGKAIARTETGEDFLVTAAFTGDGKWVVSGGLQQARLWDVASGRVIRLAHDERVLSVAVDPAGARAATASQDATVKLWSLPAGTLEHTLAHGARVEAVAFSPDGARIASVTRAGEAAVWDAASGERLVTLAAKGPVGVAVAFAGGGRLVLVARGDEARVFEVEGGRERALFSHPKKLNAAAAGPDGRTFATGSVDGSARVWDVERGLRFVLPHGDQVTDLRFCSSARLVTASIDRKARVWDATTGRLERLFSSHTDSVRSVACAPSGRWLVSGSLDGTARVWDLDVSPRRFQIDAGGPVEAVSASRDGSRFSAGRSDGSVRVWDARDRRVLLAVDEPGQLTSALLGPPGRLVVANIPADAVSVWDVDRRQRLAILRDASMAMPTHAELSPDGLRVIATAEQAKEAVVWEVATSAPIARLAGHTMGLMSGSFDPAGTRVVTASMDRTLRVWDLARPGAPPWVLSGHTGFVESAIFRPDGAAILSCGNDNAIKLWDVATGQVRRTMDSPGYRLSGGVFSPDAGTFVATSTDERVEIWDAATGRLLVQLRPHSGQVGNVAYLNQGVVLTAGLDDGSVAGWDAGWERRSLPELEAALRCRLPFDLVRGVLTQSVACL